MQKSQSGEKSVKLVFLSNYLNHHQIPFCDAMYRLLEGSFVFIQTEAVEEERVRMGWKERNEKPYLHLYYEEPGECRRLMEECGVAIFGGTDDESYIRSRLESGRPVLRYSERLYKSGQWKAVSPRGLIKKYQDHTRYRRRPVYLLCAGAYVPSDFHIVRAYPGRMLKWGYFPETRHYDVDKLIQGKGNGCVRLLWAARMIDWKHPELPVKTAAYLKERGCSFHLDMVGGGALENRVRELIGCYGLEEEVTLRGYCTPEEARELMERSHIYLATSDRKEGWGAVVNEAMNSGCAVVGDHRMGAVPYLIRHGRNGMIYRDGREKQLFRMTEELVRNRELREQLSRNAVHTITEEWNAEKAAERLTVFCEEQGFWEMPETERECGRSVETAAMAQEWKLPQEGPCSVAPVISERRMYRILMKNRNGD